MTSTLQSARQSQPLAGKI